MTCLSGLRDDVVPDLIRQLHVLLNQSFLSGSFSLSADHQTNSFIEGVYLNSDHTHTQFIQPASLTQSISLVNWKPQHSTTRTVTGRGPCIWGWAVTVYSNMTKPSMSASSWFALPLLTWNSTRTFTVTWRITRTGTSGRRSLTNPKRASRRSPTMVHPAEGVSQVQREHNESKESKPMISNNGTPGKRSLTSPKRASRWSSTTVHQTGGVKSKESKPTMVHSVGGVSQVQREQANDLRQWYTWQRESHRSKESKPVIFNNGTPGRRS